MKKNYLFGLTPLSINVLAIAIGIALVLIGIKTYQATNVSFQTNDTKLLLGGTALELKESAEQLGEQSNLIAEREQQIQDLIAIYQQSLKEAEGYDRLKKRIEALEQSPRVDGLADIKQTIYAAEGSLSEIK